MSGPELIALLGRVVAIRNIRLAWLSQGSRDDR